MRSPLLYGAAGLGLVIGARTFVFRPRELDLRGRVALVTGGSRGLGLALARELVAHGARVALCARDAAALERAQRDLQAAGGDVFVHACDVADRGQVHQLIEQVQRHFGPIEILVNNAGQIGVGPLATQTLDDFEQAMAVMFWGLVYPTLEVLPDMRARRGGRIANITSIGGKMSVPHLLPYSSAKFAAVGFSEGLRAELARDGIAVTTVVPGLMRTGSHLNAQFKGQHRLEYAWFSVAASFPLTSVSATHAAREIVRSIQRGDAELTLGWQAALAARVHGLMPGVLADVFGLVNRCLPTSGGIGSGAATGRMSQSAVSESLLTAWGRQAAAELNQQVADS